MPKWWLVIGSLQNWQTAFEHGNLSPRVGGWWEKLNRGERKGTPLFEVHPSLNRGGVPFLREKHGEMGCVSL